MDRQDRVIALIREHVPSFRMVEKRGVPWWRALGVLQPVLPLVGDAVTVIGDTVYLPRPEASFPRDFLAAILAHELVHMLDQQEAGAWFYLSYAALPLPVGRTHRARWERRAYAVELMLAWEDGGEPTLVARERWLRGVFAGFDYGWMHAGAEAAAAFLAPVVAEIRAGELQNRFPYREILAAWRGSDGQQGVGALVDPDPTGPQAG